VVTEIIVAGQVFHLTSVWRTVSLMFCWRWVTSLPTRTSSTTRADFCTTASSADSRSSIDCSLKAVASAVLIGWLTGRRSTLTCSSRRLTLSLTGVSTTRENTRTPPRWTSRLPTFSSSSTTGMARVVPVSRARSRWLDPDSVSRCSDWSVRMVPPSEASSEPCSEEVPCRLPPLVRRLSSMSDCSEPAWDSWKVMSRGTGSFMSWVPKYKLLSASPLPCSEPGREPDMEPDCVPDCIEPADIEDEDCGW
jgi:hypothetical protein